MPHAFHAPVNFAMSSLRLETFPTSTDESQIVFCPPVKPWRSDRPQFSKEDKIASSSHHGAVARAKTNEKPTGQSHAWTNHWLELGYNVGELVTGQWVYLEDAQFFVAETPSSGLQRFKCSPSCAIEDCVTNYSSHPPPGIIERWELLDTGLLANAIMHSGTLPLSLGTRVAFTTPPSTSFHGAYIVDFPDDETVEVRVAVNGSAIDPRATDLVNSLLEPPYPSDLLTVPRAMVHHHLFSHASPLAIGDRVCSGTLIGSIKRLDREGKDIFAWVKEEAHHETMHRVHASRLNRHFVQGDRVRVVHGPQAHTQGIIKRRFFLNETFKTVLAAEICSGQDHSNTFTILTTDITLVETPFTDVGLNWALQYDAGPRWLCHEKLMNRRLDVIICAKKNFARSNYGYEAIHSLSAGYIELDSLPHPNRLAKLITVYPDTGGRRARGVPARDLRPVDTCLNPKTGLICKITQVGVRIVVIGPDFRGRWNDLGLYGLVLPEHSVDSRVAVKLQNVDLSDVTSFCTNYFPLGSLCRSSNADGIKTKATRFF
ncbi:ATP-dependent DNA helicase [Mycena indigotica]|uniref:ATP-dependent DNA helicase n=1 Tax=Mycena indigotica TaxID=2126181 RepID=A0A8H6VVQ0_9AGAR|nr:ATP-dependent DNA helicase [Mycena indigotica]KAF7295637.1 ATP-dependent DNA helicase [Mycena indigotica]